MRATWQRILEAGVQHAVSSAEQRRIRLTNEISVVGAAIDAAFVGGYAEAGPAFRWPMINCIVATAIFVAAILANRKGWTLVAPLLCLGAAYAILAVNSTLVGLRMGFYFYLFFGPPLSYFFFDQRHHALRLTLGTTGILLLVALRFLVPQDGVLHIPIPPLFAAAIEASSILVVGWILGFTTYSFVGQTVRAEKRELEERSRELETRNRKITLLNEELQHQVAERSRQLTDALAQVESTLSPAPIEVGDVFDQRYRIARPLGRGGMGAVYEVERVRDGERLALKVLTMPISGRGAARFAREAEIGARVRHPNLVSIVDVGVTRGTPFLVMELVQGGSMEEHRARFGDPRWAVPILRQIASGLTELHANQVVHRDLKPGNVLFATTDAAPLTKISDFGISRYGALEHGDGHESPRELTQTGALMGTPLYMPPEAWLSPARHPSADVFSFGVLAYEALSGRAPFAAPPVMMARAGQTLPDARPIEGVREGIQAAVLACLRADPARRPGAKEIAASMA